MNMLIVLVSETTIQLPLRLCETRHFSHKHSVTAASSCFSEQFCQRQSLTFGKYTSQVTQIDPSLSSLKWPGVKMGADELVQMKCA